MRPCGWRRSEPKVAPHMSSELRWILLILGVLFIAALAVWERRRPRQASASSAGERPAPRDLLGDAGARARQEPRLILPEMSAHPHGGHELPVIDVRDGATTETDEVPVLAAVAAATPEPHAQPGTEEAEATPAAPMAPAPDAVAPRPAAGDFAY